MLPPASKKVATGGALGSNGNGGVAGSSDTPPLAPGRGPPPVGPPSARARPRRPPPRPGRVRPPRPPAAPPRAPGRAPAPPRASAPPRPRPGGPLLARIHIPERSGLPSAVRGAGASQFTFPCASRGTLADGYFGHCAATDTEHAATTTQTTLETAAFMIARPSNEHVCLDWNLTILTHAPRSRRPLARSASLPDRTLLRSARIERSPRPPERPARSSRDSPPPDSKRSLRASRSGQRHRCRALAAETACRKRRPSPARCRVNGCPQSATNRPLSRLRASSRRPTTPSSAKTSPATITSWNRAAERMFGYTAAEAVGQSIRLIIPPELHAEEEEVLLRRFRAGEGVDHYDTVRIRKDGQRIDVSLTVSPIVAPDGRIVGVSKIARDITERRRLERDARHFAAIVESSDDAIVSKDLNGTIVSWNRAAERLFGYTAAEIVGQSIRVIIPPDRQSEEDQVLAAVRRGEAVDHFETVRLRKDGTLVPISLTVSPIRSAERRDHRRLEDRPRSEPRPACAARCAAARLDRRFERRRHRQQGSERHRHLVECGRRADVRLHGGGDGGPVHPSPHPRRPAAGGRRGPVPHPARRTGRTLRDRSASARTARSCRCR